MRKDLLKGLNEEQIKKVRACKSSEEILALANKEGVTLTKEQLEAVSGGGCFFSSVKCPNCGSDDLDRETAFTSYDNYTCKNCGYKWEN